MPEADTSGAAGPAEADVTWQRPSPRLLRARRIQAAVGTLVAALAGGLIGGLVSQPVGLGVGLGLLAAGLVFALFLARRVAAWGYAERDDDLMVRRGVLIRRLSVIPYGRMQFIDVTAGPVERSLGLATLRMHTAAAAARTKRTSVSQAGGKPHPASDQLR